MSVVVRISITDWSPALSKMGIISAIREFTDSDLIPALKQTNRALAGEVLEIGLSNAYSARQFAAILESNGASVEIEEGFSFGGGS